MTSPRVGGDALSAARRTVPCPAGRRRQPSHPLVMGATGDMSRWSTSSCRELRGGCLGLATPALVNFRGSSPRRLAVHGETVPGAESGDDVPAAIASPRLACDALWSVHGPRWRWPGIRSARRGVSGRRGCGGLTGTVLLPMCAVLQFVVCVVRAVPVAVVCRPRLRSRPARG